MDRAHRSSRRGDGDRRGHRLTTSREALADRKPANDNRLSLKDWIARLVALAVVIGLAALLAWRIAG